MLPVRLQLVDVVQLVEPAAEDGGHGFCSRRDTGHTAVASALREARLDKRHVPAQQRIPRSSVAVFARVDQKQFVVEQRAEAILQAISIAQDAVVVEAPRGGMLLDGDAHPIVRHQLVERLAVRAVFSVIAALLDGLLATIVAGAASLAAFEFDLADFVGGSGVLQVSAAHELAVVGAILGARAEHAAKAQGAEAPQRQAGARHCPRQPLGELDAA
mmetsp:Transcript_22812/g.65802  ORF Transcript_22812/g.65802 Transcript_22812/m.65802 type:complete len:216 (+) Transcript_22812:476-1123(+)